MSIMNIVKTTMLICLVVTLPTATRAVGNQQVTRESSWIRLPNTQWHARALLTPDGARAATDVTVHYEPCARHDMLLSYMRETNDKILGVILGWLKERGAI